MQSAVKPAENILAVRELCAFHLVGLLNKALKGLGLVERGKALQQVAFVGSFVAKHKRVQATGKSECAEILRVFRKCG